MCFFQNNAKGFRIFYRLQLEVFNTPKNNRICPDLPWVRVHPSDHLPLRRLQHPKVLRGGDDHPLRAFAGRHRKFSRSLGPPSGIISQSIRYMCTLRNFQANGILNVTYLT